jgi:acyl-CoA synthetase (AMP-forming)/AMP-acid ligase II
VAVVLLLRRQLVAYLKIKDSLTTQIDQSLLHDVEQFVSRSLPLYMLPASVVIVKEFPLTGTVH